MGVGKFMRALVQGNSRIRRREARDHRILIQNLPPSMNIDIYAQEFH
jgi:hypothetical protein